MNQSAKFVICLLLPVCLYGSVFAQVPDAHLIQAVKKNYVAAIIGTGEEKQRLVAELVTVPPETEVSDQCIVELQQLYPIAQGVVERYLKEQRPDGSWSDIDYQDRKRSGWNAKVHADRTLLLSKYYGAEKENLSTGQRQDLSRAIHAAMNFWFKKKPVCLNWWYNEIGIPRTLGPVFLLMEDEMDDAEKRSAIEVMRKARIERTGQNKVWLAGNVLIRGLLQNDWDLVKEARNAIADEIVTGKKEGIKEDWSFHQHGAQQQFGNYGLAFISSMGLYSAVFAHTSLAFSSRQQEILTSLLLEGYRWITWRGYWDVNALNRQLFRNADIDKTLWLRFTALSLMEGSDAKTAKEIKKMVAETSLRNPTKKQFVGHKHFGDSDYTLHRTDRWMASLRMASERVIGTEQINEDNLKGYYMADGALYTYVDGDEYHHIFPLWNWRLVPGITTYLNDAPVPSPNRVDGRNHSRQVGGSSYKGNGISAMKLDRNKLQAYKSWIFTQDYILCMGSGIQADSTGILATSIDQRHYVGNEWAQGQRYFHDNTGYIVLQADSCQNTIQKEKGDWSCFMGSYAPRQEEGDLYSLYITHQTDSPASYIYVVLPGATCKQTETFDAKEIEVLQNTPEVQAAIIQGTGYISAYRPVTLTLPNGKKVAMPQAGTYIVNASSGEIVQGDSFR